MKEDFRCLDQSKVLGVGLWHILGSAKDESKVEGRGWWWLFQGEILIRGADIRVGMGDVFIFGLMMIGWG